MVFTGWYPTLENKTQHLFVSQQVRILKKWLPVISNEQWEFIVWNERIPKDIPNYVLGKKPINLFWEDDGIRVLANEGLILSHRLPINQTFFLVRGMKEQYSKIIDELGAAPDLVWIVTLSSAMLWNRFSEAHNSKIPTVLQEHSNPLSMHLRKRWSRSYAINALENIKSVVVVAERQVKEFNDLFHNVHPCIIWNPASEAFSQGALVEKYHSDTFEFLFVGRLSREKGLNRLVKAAQCLDGINIDFRIAIIGSGPEENVLKELISLSQMEHRFQWLGSKSTSEISKVMEDVHAFVLPSLYENCPVALLEAQVKGLPCVVTANGASEKVLLSGNGIAVEDGGDGKNLAKAMQQLIREYSNFDSQKIRARSLKQFSPEVFANKMYAVFNRVL